MCGRVKNWDKKGRKFPSAQVIKMNYSELSVKLNEFFEETRNFVEMIESDLNIINDAINNKRISILSPDKIVESYADAIDELKETYNKIMERSE